MKKILFLLVVVMTHLLQSQTTAWTQGLPSRSESIPIYTLGIMAKSYDEKRAMALEKFEEILAKYVEERAGMKIRLKAFTYPDLAKAIETGSVDFVWGYGLVVSMELSQKFPIVPILAPTLGEEKKSLFKRWIVASKNSIRDLADLKGKRLTHVGDEPWSFELLLLKIWMAEKLGIKDIHSFFKLKGTQPDEGFFIPAAKRGAIYSLIIKEADLAVAHEFEYVTQERLTPYAIREKTEIIPFFNPSEGFMEPPGFVRRGIHQRDVDKLVKVLMEMANNPEGKQILLSSKISGFVKVVHQDYQTVRALIAKRDELGIK
jgi:ABC-type phosphate/phosphonate transport system substrate-binding protein